MPRAIKLYFWKTSRELRRSSACSKCFRSLKKAAWLSTPNIDWTRSIWWRFWLPCCPRSSQSSSTLSASRNSKRSSSWKAARSRKSLSFGKSEKSFIVNCSCLVKNFSLSCCVASSSFYDSLKLCANKNWFLFVPVPFRFFYDSVAPSNESVNELSESHLKMRSFRFKQCNEFSDGVKGECEVELRGWKKCEFTHWHLRGACSWRVAREGMCCFQFACFNWYHGMALEKKEAGCKCIWRMTRKWDEIKL